MPKPKDIVQIIKQEDVSRGGSADDWNDFLHEPLDPWEDAPEVGGFYVQESGVSRDRTVTIYRENGEMLFEDVLNSGVNRLTLTDLLEAVASGISIADHRRIRHLIHFVDDGPGEGFTSGAVKSTGPTLVFPTEEIWWVSDDLDQKIVEKLTTYSGPKPTVEEWNVYSTDGTTKLATASDAIQYSGIFEYRRTRTLTIWA